MTPEVEITQSSKNPEALCIDLLIPVRKNIFKNFKIDSSKFATTNRSGNWHIINFDVNNIALFYPLLLIIREAATQVQRLSFLKHEKLMPATF